MEIGILKVCSRIGWEARVENLLVCLAAALEGASSHQLIGDVKLAVRLGQWHLLLQSTNTSL